MLDFCRTQNRTVTKIELLQFDSVPLFEGGDVQKRYQKVHGLWFDQSFSFLF